MGNHGRSHDVSSDNDHGRSHDVSSDSDRRAQAAAVDWSGHWCVDGHYG